MKDKIYTPFKITRKRWSDKELQKWNEEDIRYHSPIEALAGKELQLFIASFWGAVYYYCITYGDNLFYTILSWFSLTFGSLFLILFLVMYVIPRFWKWFINLV